ncbi:hypothetical protein O9992_11985 [Vibrio lentus]|nr:hypothetical protein [Vibrio lentus]
MVEKHFTGTVSRIQKHPTIDDIAREVLYVTVLVTLLVKSQLKSLMLVVFTSGNNVVKNTYSTQKRFLLQESTRVTKITVNL